MKFQNIGQHLSKNIKIKELLKFPKNVLMFLIDNQYLLFLVNFVLIFKFTYYKNNGVLKCFNFFPYEYLRITFQNKLFHNTYIHCRDVIKNKKLSQELFKLCSHLKNLYPHGYYFYGPQINKDKTTINDIKSLTNYIARYASHPAISERRITSLNIENDTVTWFYDPHEDDDITNESLKMGRQEITEDVFDFMGKLIKHIPDKGFQQIRYCLKLSFGYNPTLCKCGSQMIINLELSYFP